MGICWNSPRQLESTTARCRELQHIAAPLSLHFIHHHQHREHSHRGQHVLSIGRLCGREGRHKEVNTRGVVRMRLQVLIAVCSKAMRRSGKGFIENPYNT